MFRTIEYYATISCMNTKVAGGGIAYTYTCILCIHAVLIRICIGPCKMGEVQIGTRIKIGTPV